MDISVHELTLERVLKLEMHSSLNIYSRRERSKCSDVIEKINNIFDTRICMDKKEISFYNRRFTLSDVCDQRATLIRTNT